jgi:hypothetical protein
VTQIKTDVTLWANVHHLSGQQISSLCLNALEGKAGMGTAAPINQPPAQHTSQGACANDWTQ